MKPFLANEPQQMRAAAADHPLDLGADRARAAVAAAGCGLGWLHLDIGHQLGDRGADRGPVRLGLVAGLRSAPRAGAEPLLVPQRGQPGPAQQRPQRRIAQRRPIEFAEMGSPPRYFSSTGSQTSYSDGPSFRAVSARKAAPAMVVEAHAVSFRRNGEGGPR